MKTNFIDTLTNVYGKAPLQIRKKSRILAWCGLIIGAFSIALGVTLMLTGAVVAGAFAFVATLLAALVLYLLSTGRYTAAAVLFMFGIWFVCFCAIKFDEYKNVYETYVFGTIGGFLLILSAMLADKMFQTLLIGGLNIAAIWALYLLDSYPQDNYTFTVLAIQNLSVSMFFMIFGMLITSLLVRTQNVLIKEIEDEVRSSENNYYNLNEAVVSCQNSANTIGASLARSADHTITTIQNAHGTVQQIVKGMDDLAAALQASSSENAVAVHNQEKVKVALTGYASQVAEASSSIEQMVAAIRSINEQAQDKGQSVRALVELAQSGENKLQDIKSSIDAILQASENMMEMTTFIEDVADRTNLLGMNASIEAAHAGNAGKGFSVVADQIRSLSVEAGESTRVITTTLIETRDAIDAASKQNEEVIQFFQRISREIMGVTSMIEELLANLSEINAGANSVLSSVETVAALTGTTEETVNASCDSIEKSSAGIEQVSKIAFKVKNDSEAMAEQFLAVRRDSEEVRSLGGENLRVVESLRNVLKKVHEKV